MKSGFADLVRFMNRGGAAEAAAFLWIQIQIGSVFDNLVDLDLYSEHGSGSTQVKIGQIRGKRCKIELNNSPFGDSTDGKFRPVPLFSYSFK